MNRFDQECWICDVQETITCDSSGGGSQPSGTTTTSATTSPWSGQQGYLSQGFQDASNLLTGYTPQYYPGQTVAPLNPAQQAGIAGTQAQAMEGEPVTGSAMNFATNLENGSYFNNNPGNSLQLPFATGAMMPTSNNSYFNDLNTSIANQVMPTVEGTFGGHGNYGNPNAAYAAATGIAGAEAPQAYSAYNQGLQQMQTAGQNIASNYNTGVGTAAQSLATAPQIQQMPYNDYNSMFNSGTAQQSQSQQDINAAISQFNWQQMLPYNQLNSFFDIAGNGSYGSSSSMTTPYFQNAFANTLGGGLGGAALGAGVGSLFGGSGSSIGGVAGAGLGALLSNV